MSNTILEAIEQRRSMRKYQSTMPGDELLQQVINAGLRAPSGKNLQSSVIICITNPAMREQIRQMNCKAGGYADDFDPFYGAPAILIVLGNRECPNYIYDGSLVMSNLMLAAHAVGLASCWIHRARQEFDTPEGKQILADLGIKGDFEGIGHVAIGFPDGPLPHAHHIKENRIFYVR